ncbi:hypothetical protein HZS_2394, partial [Henneguya salminicola]
SSNQTKACIYFKFDETTKYFQINATNESKISYIRNGKIECVLCDIYVATILKIILPTILLVEME